MEKFTMTMTVTTVLAVPFWAQPLTAALPTPVPASACTRVLGAVLEPAQAFVAAAFGAAAHGTAVIDRAKRALEGSPHLSLATS